MRRLLVAAVAALAAALVLAPVAPAVDDVNTKRLRRNLTTGGVLDHMRALQRIANANEGTRAATTPGYDASLDYAERRLRRAGYRTSRDPFPFASWEQNGPATLALGATTFTEGPPEGATEGGDYVIAQFSGSGDVTGPIVPIDYTGPPAEAGGSTSGCEPADYPAPPSPSAIALVQRGTCTFVDKIAMAVAAGYGAVLVANDGFPDRIEPLQIGADPFTPVPVAMTSSTVGLQLVAAAGQELRFAVSTTTEEVTQYNLIADSRTGDPERTIVVGAHLDSVEEGPGINDNGSGTSTIIETAEQIAKLERNPRNRIRFAFWGAEEAGLVGSTAYVADLIESGEIDDIEANLNFDMLGSPNFVRFVYDGDNSTGEGAEGPPGSAEIEQVFLDYFESQDLPTTPTAFDGRSDYGPFIAPEAFVPAGGLFSGAEGVKTEEEAAIYGGAAGSWYDPCYHQACDTFSSVVYQPSLDATGLEEGSEAADAALMRGNGALGLGQLADGAAHATWTLARSRSPLVGPAVARVAKAAKARKKLRRAAKRAAKTRQYEGGQRIR